MSPPLALGQAVHEVIESLSILPTESRFRESLVSKFEKVWEKVSGKKGGFLDKESELRYKKRGEDMMRNVMDNPGPLRNLAVKINMDLPYFWLSEEDNIILCGKIDWLEYLPETDSVHIIDFKTSKGEEKADSLQLHIYSLLVQNTQKRNVAKISYWYIARQLLPTEQKMTDGKSLERILKTAKEIKLARQLEKFTCANGGCGYCSAHEKIASGEGVFVGTDNYNQDIYILEKPTEEEGGEDSFIL